jgi:hypothetical protein
MNRQQWLQTQITKFPELSARELVALLNQKEWIDNPNSQQQVPKIPTLKELRESVLFSESLEFLKLPEFMHRLESAVSQGNLEDIAYYYQLAKESNLLSEQTKAKLDLLMNQTIPDPNWQAQLYISPAELVGFEVILVNEVEEIIARVV